MEPPIPQDDMPLLDPPKSRLPLGYALAAAAIWGLVLYSLSPLSHAGKTRITARDTALCLR